MKYNQPAEAIKTEYDLNNPEEKKAVRDFEILLENLKTIPLKYPLWVYGEPKEMISAFEMGKQKFPESINPRRVRNEIVGLTDAGIVQHLLDVKAISRRNVKKEHPNYGWAVGPDLKAYENFYQKKRALDDLKNKRAYAEEKDEESFDALVKGREELIKSMKP